MILLHDNDDDMGYRTGRGCSLPHPKGMIAVVLVGSWELYVVGID